MRFFNPHDDVLITQRRLPHWGQDGAVVFITWRTHDSMPKSVLEVWRAERNRWLLAHEIDSKIKGWKAEVQELPVNKRAEYHDRFTTRWHDELDAGHGASVLRRPELAAMVKDSLLHFDGDRYEMLGFVIMPNHVHLLACFADKASMLKQCESWKHFTGGQINRSLGTKGRFWQQDSFDHLVRHEGQFRRLLSYLAENPVKARLSQSEYVLWSKTLIGEAK
jgi:REP element-mobilizing transposase RayT